jgi:hypothetical protein
MSISLLKQHVPNHSNCSFIFAQYLSQSGPAKRKSSRQHENTVADRGCARKNTLDWIAPLPQLICKRAVQWGLQITWRTAPASCAGLYSIFVIDVSLNGASALITFELCDNSDQASQRIPYRIENRCSRVMFTFSQKHVNAWQLLPPKTATPYAWDQVGSQAGGPEKEPLLIRNCMSDWGFWQYLPSDWSRILSLCNRRASVII